MRAPLLLLVTLGLAAATGCAMRVLPPEKGIDGLPESPPSIVTLTNLHPDDGFERLYAANFQQPGLIPVCSEVTLLMMFTDKMYFRVNDTGKTYWYLDYDATGEPLHTNLSHYFGEGCPKSQLDGLSAVEREGVRLGIPKKGMTKPALILAIGYPLRRDTPSLDDAVWRYWVSRFSSFTVHFDGNGVVEQVVYEDK